MTRTERGTGDLASRPICACQNALNPWVFPDVFPLKQGGEASDYGLFSALLDGKGSLEGQGVHDPKKITR